jgi:hypothetical protein
LGVTKDKERNGGFTVKGLFLSLAALIILGLPGLALADTVKLYQPTPANLNDLDHHMAYTWRIDNVNLAGQTITGAKLTFKNIRNWDGNPNMLFVHLLDTAKNAGVASFVDDPSNSSPVTDITDDFANTRYHNRSDWLVANGTADTFLAQHSFPTTGSDWVIDLADVGPNHVNMLNILAAYIANGNNFAFGLDPDCHFFNNGISFQLTTTPTTTTVPEPTTMTLLGTGLAGLYYRRRRKQQQAQS